MKDVNLLRSSLSQRYLSIRRNTVKLCAPLAIEDYVIQTIPDVSPPKWHLAHTSWFFETFFLVPMLKKYKIFDDTYFYLFNSYYNGIGKFFRRDQRGLLSRPTVTTVLKYREYVDQHILTLLEKINTKQLLALRENFVLALNHEQQHQELILMDIKHNLFFHPSYPAYHARPTKKTNSKMSPLKFVDVSQGLVNIGYKGTEFCYDNELPSHPVYLQPYAIANRLVCNKEYSEFIIDGAYQQPQWWLSDGWDYIQKNKLQSPLYWVKEGNDWYEFTLSGLRKIVPQEPVSHISYFEADAYARWCNKRLPSEAEWENFVTLTKPKLGNFIEDKHYHPVVADPTGTAQQFFGDLWEWTASPYSPYPQFKPLPGKLGEYNGKFMNNQFVLRGGCCVTPKSHIRYSYRNFFQPEKRWQFAGIRLVDSI